MIRTKWNHPLPPSIVFLIAEKLPTLLRLKNFKKFSDFQCKEKFRVIAQVD